MTKQLEFDFEAKSAARVCGCKDEHLTFLDLPFYETGTIAKNL